MPPMKMTPEELALLTDEEREGYEDETLKDEGEDEARDQRADRRPRRRRWDGRLVGSVLLRALGGGGAHRPGDYSTPC